MKHYAVGASFAKIGVEVETVAVPTQSDVSEQPMSLDETYEGAINRHKKLVEAVGNKASDSYLITVESGIFTPRPEYNYFGTNVVIVEKNNERHVGFDIDVEFPRSMTDLVPREYPDLGELVRFEFGSKIKDPYPYFTNGKLTRQTIIENALYNVLIQFDTQGK